MNKKNFNNITLKDFSPKSIKKDKNVFFETDEQIKIKSNYYSKDLLSSILKRSASILEIEISKDAAIEISSRSRGTPRIANGLLRRIRDFAQIKGDGRIDLKITKKRDKNTQ